MKNETEASFTTGSIGLVAFLLWHHIYPIALTLEPYVACVYFDDDINWGELINSYWMGEKIPSCELSECICVAERILRDGMIERKWFREMRKAIDEVREDYIFPVFE